MNEFLLSFCYYLLPGTPIAFIAAHRLSKFRGGRRILFSFLFWLIWPYFALMIPFNTINHTRCQYCGQRVANNFRATAQHLSQCQHFLEEANFLNKSKNKKKIGQ